MSAKKTRKLTRKQEKLVEGIIAGKSGAQAARDAGYSPDKPENARQSANVGQQLRPNHFGLKAQIKGPLLLSKEEKATLAEIAHRVGIGNSSPTSLLDRDFGGEWADPSLLRESNG